MTLDRALLWIVGMFLSLFVLAALTGCNASPHTRYAIQRGTLNAVQDSLVDLHVAGFVSDDQALEVVPYLKAARGHLDRAKQKLPVILNDPVKDTEFDIALSVAADLLITVQQFLLEYRKNGPSSSSGSTVRIGEGWWECHGLDYGHHQLSPIQGGNLYVRLEASTN